jgi:N-acylneuraminate cytidylyltransferase/CMP-N,N'-diacetyllegionaminic acid synthase
MKNGWKVLCIVTARGGSKGLPGKNVRLLLGKPLIAWSIEAGLHAPSVDTLIVSTDAETIAQAALDAGARVPFVRPENLSGDTSSSIDVVLHAIDWLVAAGEHYDVVVLLEPTSPLRESADIETALEFMASSGAGAVVSVCRAESVHPAFMYRRDDGGRLYPFLEQQPTGLRRQEIEPLYFLEGTIYASNVELLRQHRSFYREDTVGYEVPRWKSLEIDEFDDFLMVEALLKHRKKQE